MITPPVLRAALARPTAPAACGATWDLLAPGDEVSIAGSGAYEIVCLSDGRAWLSGLVDGDQRLADASSLRLRRAAVPAGHH